MTCAQPIPGAGGAGFAGLIAALELRRAGCESFVIFERGDEVGGVWMARENFLWGAPRVHGVQAAREALHRLLRRGD